jgi:hypothetical protein
MPREGYISIDECVCVELLEWAISPRKQQFDSTLMGSSVTVHVFILNRSVWGPLNQNDYIIKIIKVNQAYKLCLGCLVYHCAEKNIVGYSDKTTNESLCTGCNKHYQLNCCV